MSAPRVGSEIGRLRKVLVHKPGIELARLTPRNRESFLFEDILWVERARDEHDRFVELLRSRGAEVLHLRTLLEEVLEDEGLRREVVNRLVPPVVCGPRLSRYLRRHLRESSPADLVDVLLGGLLREDLKARGIDPLFADLISDRYDWVLPPLPNLFFMRDNASWIGDGLSLNVLASPARASESVLVRAIYRHHPLFADLDFPTWYGDEAADRFPATVEGGDILVLDEETVLIGCGERTAPAAVEILAHRLFDGSPVRNMIVAHFRRERAVMHLDTVLTMVDVNRFNFYPGILDGLEVYLLRPGRGGKLSVLRTDGLEKAIAACLPRDDTQFITSGKDGIDHIREQWDDGHNTLALEPGVVVSYARNRETNRRLRDAGVEVLELDASELCRGRGGSRCMTQPLLRDEVDWNR
ncbi:MAG: arginine deiminase [Gemmatimonadota bacterium]|jgi:arginine deiminase|nr:arginine deiminase [Gemmatimonadota bacterium]MDP6801706.1 arginine deiminase [Gemmatimonadota bacterium]MDP7031218.1 arginine deiminase [Gemmatimonadota bacterium]